MDKWKIVAIAAAALFVVSVIGALYSVLQFENSTIREEKALQGLISNNGRDIFALQQQIESLKGLHDCAVVLDYSVIQKVDYRTQIIVLAFREPEGLVPLVCKL